MSGRNHSFGTIVKATRRTRFSTEACSGCGLRRRRCSYRDLRFEFRYVFLYQLPGRLAWTTQKHSCADVRAGKARVR